MHEIVRSLEDQLNSHGCIALDKVQSEHLVLWLKAVLLIVEQQDALLVKLKEMCKLQSEWKDGT